jgi:hypothetical protein
MNTLKLDEQTAKKLFDESPDWFKEQLTEAFGKGCFEKRTYEGIKTFDDACKALGVTPEEILNANDSSDENAYKKLKIVVKAINQGWTPDWTNTDQRKYYPYFVLSSGFGFSASYYYFVYADTIVGSRLCFETYEQASYAGQQFLELYRIFLT